jgi:type VI secretion system protein ImpE
MSATDLFKAGQLQDAIDAQLKEVKANPGDHGKRLFLFELLAFTGDLDRAARQIDVVNYGDMALDVAVLNYRKALDAERARRLLFSAGQSPEFLQAPPEHVKVRLDAVNRWREGQAEEATALLAKANEMAPVVKGVLNDTPFDFLRDWDDLFGTVLEVFAKGKYFWVPLEQVETLALNPPRFPRDLLWFPARLEVHDGQKGEVFLPALYPGSHVHPDTEVRLGRKTDLKPLEGGAVLGLGLRTFFVDEETVSLLDWRMLEVDHGEAPAAEAPAAPEAPPA